MTTAFKEWALIVDALGKGKQNLILRKGGIAEEGPEFNLKAKKFLLLPTQFHQSKDLIKPSWQNLLDGSRFQIDEHHVWLEYFAEVVDTRLLSDWEALKKLANFHAWTEEAIREKFNRWEKSIHLLIVQVSRLPQPVNLLMRPEYAGCKSWVELEETIPLEGSPVINKEIV